MTERYYGKNMKTLMTFLLPIVVVACASPCNAQTAPRSNTTAFLIEATAATAGSLVGFSAVYLTRSDCGDDLACIIKQVGAAVIASTAFYAGGAYFVGKQANTNPSPLGVTLGAIAGAGAGLFIWHAVDQDLEITRSNAAGIATYVISQGIVTAIGSAIARR